MSFPISRNSSPVPTISSNENVNHQEEGVNHLVNQVAQIALQEQAERGDYFNSPPQVAQRDEVPQNEGEANPADGFDSPRRNPRILTVPGAPLRPRPHVERVPRPLVLQFGEEVPISAGTRRLFDFWVSQLNVAPSPNGAQSLGPQDDANME